MGLNNVERGASESEKERETKWCSSGSVESKPQEKLQ